MNPPPTTKGKKIAKINRLTQAQLIKLLLDGTYTCAELAEMTGLHYVTVLDYTRELHRAGAAHISSWEKDSRGRDVRKVYKIGEGKDAKRQKMTAAQRQAKQRDKHRNAALSLVTAGKARYVQSANGGLRLEKLAA